MKAFLIKLTSAALLILAAAFIIAWKKFHGMPTVIAYMIIGILYLATYLGYKIVRSAATKNNRQFVTYFMGAFGGKFLIATAFFVTVVYVDPVHKFYHAAIFGMSYVLFTVLEVISMIKVVRNSSPNREG